MIKFGLKLGVAAGTIYFVAGQGVWKDSETTIKLYNTIKSNVSPYTEEMCKQVPFEIPSLPQTNEISYLANYYWNRGVMAVFNFLSNTPTYVNDLSSKGYQAILDNKEVKNLFVESVDDTVTKQKEI